MWYNRIYNEKEGYSMWYIYLKTEIHMGGVIGWTPVEITPNNAMDYDCSRLLCDYNGEILKFKSKEKASRFINWLNTSYKTGERRK